MRGTYYSTLKDFTVVNDLRIAKTELSDREIEALSILASYLQEKGKRLPVGRDKDDVYVIMNAEENVRYGWCTLEENDNEFVFGDLPLDIIKSAEKSGELKDTGNKFDLECSQSCNVFVGIDAYSSVMPMLRYVFLHF